MSEIDENYGLPAASEIITVLGIVAPFGVGGGKAGDDELWLMTFAFDGWRIESLDLQHSRLGISRHVSDEELDKFQDLIQSYSIIRIRAEVAAHSTAENRQVVLIEYLGVETDDLELNERAAELQKPVTFVDSLFGTLTFDRGLSWYKGETVWNGNSVSLSLSAENSDEVQNALNAAHALWQDQSGWNQKLNEYAVQQLLPLKNDFWLDDDEDETELTAEDFLGRMKLKSISVESDGSFTFWHDDGDLFFGHSIQISGDLVKGLSLADIPG